MQCSRLSAVLNLSSFGYFYTQNHYVMTNLKLMFNFLMNLILIFLSGLNIGDLINYGYWSGLCDFVDYIKQ